jgi:hypothetical protein
MKPSLKMTFGAVVWTAILLQPATALAQGTAITYQGRLDSGGAPANGLYDLRFTVHDAASGGNQWGPALTNSPVAVSNGLFIVTLDFGAGVFNGGARWLEIAVRTNGGGDFTVLSPRQQLTAAPYAITAGSLTGTLSASQLSGTIAPAHIASGSISGTMLATGAVGSDQLADGAVTAAKLATVSNWFALTLTKPSPAPGDFFGQSLTSVGMDKVLIGVPSDDTGAAAAGAAYLFSTNGALITTFTNPTPDVGDGFGHSVAVVGADRVLIGAYQDDTGATDAGAAYLFNTQGALLLTLTNPTPAVGDYFGCSVAAAGNGRLLIGADFDDTGGTNAGAAYLFSTNGNLLATITKSTPVAWDSFGYAVAAVGNDRWLIGAPGDDTGTNAAGAAYLFSTDGVQLTVFTNPAPAFGDWFSRSVAAVGTDRVLIGADRDDTGASDAGAAYLFSTNGLLLATLSKPAPAANDYFGISVAAVGPDRLLVGAHSDDTGTISTGAAYLFDTNGVWLLTVTNPTPATGDRFGYAVAAAGTGQLLIGAPQDDTGGADTGAAYLITLESYSPGIIAAGVRAGAITAASFADGTVLLPNQIPDLPASKITSGTLSDARLSANVALRAGGNSFTGQQIVTGGAVGIGTTAPDAPLHVQSGSVGVGLNSRTVLGVERVGDTFIQVLTTTSNYAGVVFGSAYNSLDASVRYNVWGKRDLSFRTDNGTRMIILTNGYVGIANTSPTNLLMVANARCDGSSWINASDRRLKQDFAPVDPQAVLEKVVALSVQQWSYQAQPDQRHLGPVAQDFHAAFGLGADETSIATVDADGVALAAIQGLNQKLEQKLEQKETEIAELKQRLSALEKLLQPMNPKGE